ncbi:HEAT repeat domain-containing protein [Fusobacterium russii]|uniref:HEAT repeat domain-containing protein n=1 Tax=Fusobacterium russii TaxID=854 RepID=UPI0003A2409F|nr:HEAT repeat domain-containing protein [Fusobacterium russii]
MTEKEQKDIINELNSYGYNFRNINDIMKIGKNDKILIFPLLKWIKKLTKPVDKEWVARCLTVKGYTEATETLLKIYKEMDKNEIGKRWAIGNAIGEISDKRYIDDYIEIITDKSNGSARQMIVNYMGAFKEERVKEVLISLLDDEEVNGHAIYALSKFKDISLIEKLEPFTAHKMTWKRNEAKKAIAKLEKLKEKEGK